jgi:ribosomal protein S18 acetylase RimI-like enzyme
MSEKPIERNPSEVNEERMEKKVLRNTLADCPDCFTFFYPEDNPKGFIDYRIHNDSLQIYSIYVHRKHREEGIGKAMFNKSIEIAKKIPRDKITITSGTSSKDVFHKFLTSLGFTNNGGNWVYKIQ